MGYSTTTIRTEEAQEAIKHGKEVKEASQSYDLGTLTLNRMKNKRSSLWNDVKECELGDNDRLYITFQNGDFIVIDL